MGMSWGEIILGIVMIILGIQSPEELLGQTILLNSGGNPFYTAIFIGVKALPYLGVVALVDGIRRKFSHRSPFARRH